VLRTVLIGGGATLVMDGWALLLRRFGIPSLKFAFLGRGLGNLPRGKVMHESIAKAAPVGRATMWPCEYCAPKTTFGSS
jgi:hypothetical protein